MLTNQEQPTNKCCANLHNPVGSCNSRGLDQCQIFSTSTFNRALCLITQCCGCEIKSADCKTVKVLKKTDLSDSFSTCPGFNRLSGDIMMLPKWLRLPPFPPYFPRPNANAARDRTNPKVKWCNHVNVIDNLQNRSWNVIIVCVRCSSLGPPAKG